MQRLIAKLIINTQVTIRNLHVRIEEAHSSSPLAVGVFFPELAIQSTNAQWKPMYNTEPPMAYKVCLYRIPFGLTLFSWLHSLTSQFISRLAD